MAIIYEAIRFRRHPMKRLLVLLLLVLMPLQLVWAASGACCGPDEGKRAQHACEVAQQCGDDGGGAGSLADDGGCDCCHHFCGGALLASHVVLPAAEQGLDTVFDPPHYTSYIPDLIPPPKRPFRA